MDFDDALRRRRMCRDYLPDPIAPDVLAGVLDAANRAPSAGWTQATEFVVLEGAEETERFWRNTFPDGRDGFRWQGLFEAPVVIVPLTRPEAYVERYAEDDKAGTGLGGSVDDWPVPYWFVDAAMAVENLLLAAADRGLGALFFGIFRGEAEVLADLGVPAGWRPMGAVPLGWPRAHGAGRSSGRGRRPLDDVIHRGRW